MPLLQEAAQGGLNYNIIIIIIIKILKTTIKWLTRAQKRRYSHEDA